MTVKISLKNWGEGRSKRGKGKKKKENGYIKGILGFRIVLQGHM